MSCELPEKIETGGELDVQLAPLGDFPNRGTVQHIDAEAVQTLVRAFSGEVLVDVGHESENGGSTEV